MLIQTTKDLAKYFEKLCNIKKDKDIKEALKLEAENIDGEYTSERVCLYNYLCEGITPADYEEAKILKMLKYYKESLATFQKMAQQVANTSTLNLEGSEIKRINDLLNFTIQAPKIRYRELGKKQVVIYPSFLPKETKFPLLSACTFLLCEITNGNAPYSLKVCGYRVPPKEPCKKILLEHRKGRKRGLCASHKTYKSERKKRLQS